jgi:type II secretory pathway pseudopilin PulG
MELLVVIAIIGILASVVLASLNTARSKGSDAAVKSSINNSRAQAELYYDANGNSYASVCASTTGGIANMKAAADNANGAGAVVCNDSATTWALQGQLVANSGQYYCADSTGKSSTSSAAIGAGLACP